jgi:ABC-type transport system substrate-binding protein
MIESGPGRGPSRRGVAERFQLRVLVHAPLPELAPEPAGGTCWNKQWNTIAPRLDLDKANALLNSSGYRIVNGKRTTPDGKPLTLRIATNSTVNNQLGDYLVSQFAKLNVDSTRANLSGGAG